MRNRNVCKIYYNSVEIQSINVLNANNNLECFQRGNEETIEREKEMTEVINYDLAI